MPISVCLGLQLQMLQMLTSGPEGFLGNSHVDPQVRMQVDEKVFEGREGSSYI